MFVAFLTGVFCLLYSSEGFGQPAPTFTAKAILGGGFGNEHEGNHCESEETSYFSCQVKSGKTVSLCGSRSLRGEKSFLQYRFGYVGFLEFEFPAERKYSLQKFSFSSLGTSSLAESISFSNVGHQYTLMVSLVTGPSGLREPAFAGVVVGNKLGKKFRMPCKSFPGWGFDTNLVKALKKPSN